MAMPLWARACGICMYSRIDAVVYEMRSLSARPSNCASKRQKNSRSAFMQMHSKLQNDGWRCSVIHEFPRNSFDAMREIV